MIDLSYQQRYTRGWAVGGICLLACLLGGMLIQQPTAAQYLALARQAQGNLAYGRAIAWYRAAARLDPGTSASWVGIAQIRLAQQEPADAASAIQQAARLAPRDAGIWDLAGDIAAANHDASGAAVEWKKAISFAPQSDAGQAAALSLMRAALRQGKPAAALAASEPILQPTPEIALARAIAYLHTGDAQIAAEIFAGLPQSRGENVAYATLAATWRNDPAQLAALGYADLSLGMPALALAPLQAALARDATYGAGHGYLGWAWLQLGLLPQARAELGAAQRNAPDLAITASLRAELAADDGNFAAALRDLERWQAAHTPSVTLWEQAYAIALRQGDMAAAADAAWNAATLATGDDRLPALLALARFYAQTGLGRDDGHAQWAMEELWRLAPADAQVIDLAGQWAELTGNMPAALADYLLAAQRDPARAAYHADVGLLEYQLGDVAAARLQLAEAGDLDPAIVTAARLQPIFARLGIGADG